MSSQNESIEEVAKKTDLGDFINSNGKLITITGIIAVTLILGLSYMKTQNESADNEMAKMIYEFNSVTVKALKDKKIKADDFVAKFNSLPADIIANPTMIPTAIEAAKTLQGTDNTKEAASILEKVYSTMNKKSYGMNFIGNFLAVLYEDLDQADKAIATLEEIGKSKVKVLEPNLYLNLGRLYKKSKDVEKAKLNFNYVIEKFPNDEMAKLAKFYLKEL